MKLSKTQQDVVNNLKQGKIIYASSGIYATCWYKHNNKVISLATRDCLIEKGAVKIINGQLKLTNHGK